MKIRESGMPDESMWNTFFDVQKIMSSFGIDKSVKDVVEFGSGYGTFTIPIAKNISGKIIGLEIEDSLVNKLKTIALTSSLTNIDIRKCDFITEGSGLEENSVDFVLMFNILHGKNPELLLKEGFRILKPTKTLAIMHWNYDESTPRGPPMNIRPKPLDLISNARAVGFRDEVKFDFKPYHYGISLKK